MEEAPDVTHGCSPGILQKSAQRLLVESTVDLLDAPADPAFLQSAPIHRRIRPCSRGPLDWRQINLERVAGVLQHAPETNN